MPAICASILEKNVSDFLTAAKSVEVDLIEVRADGLSNCTLGTVHHLLLELKKTTSARIILTVRIKDEGGQYEGTETERRRILLDSLHLVDMVDIELKSSIREEVVSKAKSNKIGVIISYHDFTKTPSSKKIEDIISSEIRAGADLAKVAFKPNSMRDVVELLRVTEKLSEESRIITISMGEQGGISRIAGPVFGSQITYASVGKKTAPGQQGVEEMKTIFKILGLK
jgi:3-dehydroquinate dehydratase-1